jgi:hypothetical protein
MKQVSCRCRTCCDESGTCRSRNRSTLSRRAEGPITPTTALPETFVPCKRSIGRSNATGAKCCAAGAGAHHVGHRSCDQSCTFPIGSYKLSQCCESSSEERSAGNLHATFCGNRGRATASGDPVVPSNGHPYRNQETCMHGYGPSCCSCRANILVTARHGSSRNPFSTSTGSRVHGPAQYCRTR